MGISVFENCFSLETITMHSKITSIENYAFDDCGIKDVYFNGAIEDWCNISFMTYDSNPVVYGPNFYILDDNGDIEYSGKKYSLLTELVIPGTITTIARYQFYGFKCLTSILLPSSVKDIGSSAFSNCDNLTSIYYGGAAEQYATLSNKPSTGTVYYYSETEPAEAGNYWHYDTDGVTPVVWAQNA